MILKRINPILAVLLFFAAALQAATKPVIERVYVQTDKQVYLAGENLWAKLYITDPEGKLSTFSKIVYLELIGDSTPFVQQKIDVFEGTADSRIHLPVELPTGHYRLEAYTRAMQNEGEAVFFSQVITIYNPFTTEKIGNPRTSSKEVSQPIPARKTSSIVRTDQPTYTSRSSGQVLLEGLPQEDFSLAVSIVQKETLPGMATKSIGQWKQELVPEQSPKVASYLPEYEGHIVLGNITEDSALYIGNSDYIVPLIAFPGKGISLFSGKRDENGLVHFFSNRIDGTEDVITTVLSVSGKPLHVNIQSPFSSHHYREFPVPALSDTFQTTLLERSIGIQAMQAFYGDTLVRTTYGAAHIVGTPDRSYKLDEYTRFTTMAEVITEFVMGVRFKKINGQRYLSILTEERIGFTTANTLVLLDGVPLLNHEAIYEYDPLLVEQIDIYQGKYFFGGQLFDGIVYFQTYDRDFKGVHLDAGTQLFSYKGTEPHAAFFVPDYADPEQKQARLPDMRHTLLWKPDIRTAGRQTIQIPFFTSDLKGEFLITVEGISKNGQVLHAQTSFRVE